ncbi:MAG TPA: gluconeogenesis factor YvcK family protein, partial [Myxococcaceae bacterium]|nr:gluconeogenesis factor YvcK family protein [Myxococcaceae bacterium]
MSQSDESDGAAMSGGADWSAAALAPSIERGVEEEINPVPRQRLDRRPLRLVCIGGGTGLPMVLRGLVRRIVDLRYPEPQITAIVAMSDDGGSSGRLRRSRGSLPPGDVRKCLVALASGNNELSKVFRYRFGGRAGLAGHAVGNLLITAMAELKGDFLEAIKSSAELLGARGTVLPCTLSPVELVAYKAGGACVAGERNLGRVPGRVVRIGLRPKAVPAVDAALEAIESADLISIGPGSLYSSILPNLLVDGVARALRQ